MDDNGTEFVPVVGNIKPFRFWVQHILPLAYDDSLSYLEVLYKVKLKLNEVVDWANKYQSDLYEYVEKVIAQAQQELEQELAQYQSEVNGRLSQQDQQINRIASQLNNQLNTVNQLISQFQTETNNTLSAFRLEMTTQMRQFETEIGQQIQDNEAWVKGQILILQNLIQATTDALTEKVEDTLAESEAYTDEQIQKLRDEIGSISSIAIKYPGDGVIVNVQEAVDRLYYDLSYFALTAKEYDDLQLTAKAYDDYMLTAYTYDLWARWYLTNFGNGGDGLWIKITQADYNTLSTAEKNNGKAYLVY